MGEATHVYTAPHVTDGEAIPAELARDLDGTDLLTKTQALRLSTVDEHGWPHAALLSAGDTLALPPSRIRLMVFVESTTTANLMRDERLTMSLVLDGGMCELRLRARRLERASDDMPLALFEATPEVTRFHRAPYADVTGGITFALHDPQSVLARWQRQIAAMRDDVSAE